MSQTIAEDIGVTIPRILVPRPGIDLHKWAVIACDQFTSEPGYWQEVAALVGDAPSTYHLILPEAYLDSPEDGARVQSIQGNMRDYLDAGVFQELEGPVLVRREAAGRMRHGIMLALDLDRYDYRTGSTSLIRATEGTILERIPPRVRIRAGAPLELPHIMVLIDDPGRTVIEPLVAASQDQAPLYDFELMLGSGHLTGYHVKDVGLQRRMLDALRDLAAPDHFRRKYGLPDGSAPLLFAMGDGNHSLATAKTIWERLKPQVKPDHPARFALVEIENIHDPGLVFEPIFRVLYGVTEDPVAAISRFYSGRVRIEACEGLERMQELVDGQPGPEHAVGIITPAGSHVVYISDPPSNLPVGTLQAFLDSWGKAGAFGKVDYVHGLDVVQRIGSQPSNAGFYLPAIDKHGFFKTVILDGALPRKTFSMGEAREKRFYLEARSIA